MAKKGGGKPKKSVDELLVELGLMSDSGEIDENELDRIRAMREKNWKVLNEGRIDPFKSMTPEGYSTFYMDEETKMPVKKGGSWGGGKSRGSGAGSNWDDTGKKSGLPKGTGQGRNQIATPNQIADANGMPTNEYMRLANDLKTNELMRRYGEFANMDPEQMDMTLPERNPDWLGWVSDAGRMVTGFAGMQEDLPEYKPSAEMLESIADARRQKEIGLSAEEEVYMSQGADRAYASDVSNIRRLSGGSAGTALANLGSASSRYFDNMAGIAATDQQVRRQAERRFDERAGQAENIKRLQHAEKRDLAERNIAAASGLMGDAIENMRERRDFEKQYGAGSAHAMFEDEMILSSRQSRLDRENAAKMLYESELGKFRDDIIRQDMDVKGARVYSTDEENNQFLETKRNEFAQGNALNPDVAFAEAMGYSGGEDVTVKTKPTKGDDGTVYAGDVKYSTSDYGGKKSEDVLTDVQNLPEDQRADYLSKNNPHNQKREEISAKLSKLKEGSEEYDKILKEMEALDNEAIKWEDDILSKIK